MNGRQRRRRRESPDAIPRTWTRMILVVVCWQTRQLLYRRETVGARKAHPRRSRNAAEGLWRTTRRGREGAFCGGEQGRRRRRRRSGG